VSGCSWGRVKTFFDLRATSYFQLGYGGAKEEPKFLFIKRKTDYFLLFLNIKLKKEMF